MLARTIYDKTIKQMSNFKLAMKESGLIKSMRCPAERYGIKIFSD